MLRHIARSSSQIAAARPTAINLRWALDRMRRVAAQAPGEGAALWDRLKSEATAIWEEDRAMCRRIGEAGLPLRSEEHTSELQSRPHLVCRLLLEKKKPDD